MPFVAYVEIMKTLYQNQIIKFVALALASLFITSCNPSTSAKSILENLEHFSKKFSESHSENGIEIEIRHKFLSQQDEVDGEAKAVFDTNKAKTQDILTKLQAAAVTTDAAFPGADFSVLENNALISVGSSSTQAYYIDTADNNTVKGLMYSVGTTTADNKDKLNAMVDDVIEKSKKNNLIFFNSISYAVLKDKMYSALTGTNMVASFAIEKKKKDKSGMEPDTAGIAANIVRDHLASKSGINALIYSQGTTEDPASTETPKAKFAKFSNKWTEYVMSKEDLPADAQAMVFDWGGSSFSGYTVGQDKKVAGVKLFKDEVEKTKEDEWNQKPVVEHYKLGGSDIPAELMRIRSVQIGWAMKWAQDPNLNKTGVKKIIMFVFQTGQLRQLYFDVKNGIEPELVTALALPVVMPSFVNILRPEAKVMVLNLG